jgi:hypothetical protein
MWIKKAEPAVIKLTPPKAATRRIAADAPVSFDDVCSMFKVMSRAKPAQ